MSYNSGRQLMARGTILISTLIKLNFEENYLSGTAITKGCRPLIYLNIPHKICSQSNFVTRLVYCGLRDRLWQSFNFALVETRTTEISSTFLYLRPFYLVPPLPFTLKIVASPKWCRHPALILSPSPPPLNSNFWHRFHLLCVCIWKWYFDNSITHPVWKQQVLAL